MILSPHRLIVHNARKTRKHCGTPSVEEVLMSRHIYLEVNPWSLPSF
jgi:hypothetical protein